MRFVQWPALAVLAGLAFGVGYVPAADVAPPPTAKATNTTSVLVKGQKAKDGPVSPPGLEGEDKVDYLGHVRLTNVPADAIVFWDISPDTAEVYEADAAGEMLFAGPPGSYKIRARGIAAGKKFTLTKTQEITKGGVEPNPNPNPKPGPQPKPDPTPTPPLGSASFFVVVEDTDKAQAWRGDLLGSPVVRAAYAKLQGTRTNPVHRLISVRSASETPEVKKFITLAQGKDLPWMWLLDANHRVIDDAGLKVPIEAATFAATIWPEAPHQRAMGNIPPPEGKLKYTWTKFGAHPNVPLIPRDQWKEVDLGAFLPPVKDQDGIGACNAFAGVTALEACRNQAGLKPVRLSPAYLYGKINGGSDQGSMLEDALAWLTEHGTVPNTVVSDLDWRKGRAFNGDTLSADYRIVEAFECPNFDAMASALQQGFFIDEGLMWFNNFTPDREGWLPAAGRGGAGGHALCGYGLAKRNGVWGIKTRNSWGTSWGVNGNCVIPEPLFGRQIGGFWAVRAAVQTPTDFSTRRPVRNRLDDAFTRADFTLVP